MSFEIFDWSGIRPGAGVEVLDDGLVVARVVIEDVASDQGVIRLMLSYGRGERIYRREDGWHSHCPPRIMNPVVTRSLICGFVRIREKDCRRAQTIVFSSTATSVLCEPTANLSSTCLGRTRPCFADHAAELGRMRSVHGWGQCRLSAAGVGSRWGSTLAAVAVDNL